MILKDALEIRTYQISDRALIQYADKLEASEQGLPVLLKLSPLELSSRQGINGCFVGGGFGLGLFVGEVGEPCMYS